MLTRLIGSVAAAFLPDPERSALERRTDGDSGLPSFLIGIAEFVLGLQWFYESAMTALSGMADTVAEGYLAEANRRTVGPEETLGFTWSGAVLWIFWLMRPTTWFVISVPIVGLVRVVSYLSSGQAIGEPTVWAATRLFGLVRSRAAAANERARFGAADEPDEVDAESGHELSIYSARAHDDWNELVTIELDGRYWRVTGHEFVERAGRRRHRYHLTEAGEHEVIRRLLRYELPKTGIRWKVAGAGQASDPPVTPAPAPPPSAGPRRAR